MLIDRTHKFLADYIANLGDVTASQKAIMWTLLNRMDDELRAEIGLIELCRECGFACKSSLIKNIKALLKKGLLVKVTYPEGNKANAYMFKKFIR